jgi:hypothetical protein
MSWRCNNYSCSECSYYDVDRVVRRDEQDNQLCPECGAALSRELGAPAVMGVALPDGTYRGVEYQKMKEAAKLEKQAANLPVEKRQDLKKEIRKLRSK